jgi:molecular chaperone HtpG
MLFIPPKSIEMFRYNKGGLWSGSLCKKEFLIQHKSKDILPEYLSFIRGVVDSEDLPLEYIKRDSSGEYSISRKFLRRSLHKYYHILPGWQRMNLISINPSGKSMEDSFKMGYTDFTNQDKFMQLLRFQFFSQRK